MARVIQVIECEVRRGQGVEGDPVRMVRQLWTFDGELIVEFDPCVGQTYALPAATRCERSGHD